MCFVFLRQKPCPSRTSFGMRMRNLSFLSKKVQRYGHNLRSALFMRMKTKFCGKKYNFQCNFSQKKVWLGWKKILYFNQDFINIVFLMRLSFLSKKVMRYGHILRPVQVKKDNKKVRLGCDITLYLNSSQLIRRH